MQQPQIPRWTPTSPTITDGRDYDPFDHAAQLGINVIFRPIRTANELWLPDYDTLVIRTGMRAVHQRTAATHGLGHAVLGHAEDRPKHEVQADRWAAERLIDPLEVRELVKWAPDTARLAAELGVTTRVLQVYLNVHRLAG